MNSQESTPQERVCSTEHISYKNCMKLKIFESNCVVEKYQFLQCVKKEAPFVAIPASFAKKIESLPSSKGEHQAIDDDRGLSLGSFTP
jgi:hypothetical protein